MTPSLSAIVVTTSDDAGITWAESGSIGETPQAFWAGPGGDDGVRVVAVTPDTVLESTDAGATFVDALDGAGGDG